MIDRSFLFASVLALACGVSLAAADLFAADKVQPVRMGAGIMTFETVPGWGLRPDGTSALGPTHGGVVIDKEGNIYTSTNTKGVVVFSPDGKEIGIVRDWNIERLSDGAKCINFYQLTKISATSSACVLRDGKLKRIGDLRQAPLPGSPPTA